MAKIIIIGAAGRMGRRLIALTLANPRTSLAGAIEAVNHPSLGQDAGELAGTDSCGIAVSSDLEAALQDADAIIDFSIAKVALPNARLAVDRGVAVVLGTTGLDDNEKQAVRQLGDDGGRVVFAPNFSVGVNLLFELARQVAGTLGEDYDIEVVEMHHNQKVDAPSGTAERLGEILADARQLNYQEDTRHGRHGLVGARTKKEIGMHTLRGGDVVGEHTVMFATNGERIELTHKASSRDTFANGAIRAAEFLVDAKPGLYDMKDVLGL